MITRRQFLIGVAASASLVAVPTIAIPPSWIGHLDEPAPGNAMPIRLLDGETLVGTGAATFDSRHDGWVTTFIPGAATGLVTTIEYDHRRQTHRYEIPSPVHILSSDSFEVTIKIGQTLSQ